MIEGGLFAKRYRMDYPCYRVVCLCVCDLLQPVFKLNSGRRPQASTMRKFAMWLTPRSSIQQLRVMVQNIATVDGLLI